MLECFSKSERRIVLKPHKIFECSCFDGYTGDFCEFKIEQDHLLFVIEQATWILDADGRLIEENAVDVGERSRVHYSCSTMLNGEAIIFGGWTFRRQVRLL